MSHWQGNILLKNWVWKAVCKIILLTQFIWNYSLHILFVFHFVYVCMCVQRGRAQKESLLLFFTSQLLKNIVDLGKNNQNKQASMQTTKTKSESLFRNTSLRGDLAIWRHPWFCQLRNYVILHHLHYFCIISHHFQIVNALQRSKLDAIC